MAAPNLDLEKIIREDNFGDLTTEFVAGFECAVKLLHNSFSSMSASHLERDFLIEVLDAHLKETEEIRQRGEFDG